MTDESTRDLPWQPIKTAPKDGTEFVAWCYPRQHPIMQCRWGVRSGCWQEYGIDGFDNMSWVRLEAYEQPTHWMMLTPPRKEDDDDR